MKSIIHLAAALALILPQTSFAEDLLDLPSPRPKARDLYVGCSLLIRGAETDNVKESRGNEKAYTPPYSALQCSFTALIAYGYAKEIKPGNDWEYCLPDSALLAADPVKAMAAAYVETYEKSRFPDPGKDGLTMMLYMFKIAFPCSGVK